MRKRTFAVAAAVLGVLLLSGAALASHSWSNYHWPSDNRTLEAKDSTTSAVFGSGGAASGSTALAEWNSSSDGAVSYQEASGTPFDVEVREGKLPKIWLGVARVKVDDAGHIQAGLV